MTWVMHHGDSLIRLRDLPSESVDALITDPPYSSGGMFRGDRQGSSSSKYVSTGTEREYPEIVGDNRDQRAYLAWCSLWLAECLRIARDGAFVALFTDWRQLPVTTDALQCGGWQWRGIASWCKPDPRPQLGRPSQSSEFVVWGSKGAMPLDRGCPTIMGHWVERSPREREHMTEKPIGVVRDLAKLCAPGGTILDPFAGAATTGVAALLEGRGFVGIEASAEYFEIA
ncbi:MAG: DNA methyltransferase, partial [Alphaproteobacteria bacterium]